MDQNAGLLFVLVALLLSPVTLLWRLSEKYPPKKTAQTEVDRAQHGYVKLVVLQAH